MNFRFITETELRSERQVPGSGEMWVPFILLWMTVTFTFYSLRDHFVWHLYFYSTSTFLTLTRFFCFYSSVRSQDSPLYLSISARNQHSQNTDRGVSLLTLHTSESGEQPQTDERSHVWPPCWVPGLCARLWHTSRWQWHIFWPDLFERLWSISCLLPATLQRLWDCRQGWHY